MYYMQYYGFTFSLTIHCYNYSYQITSYGERDREGIHEEEHFGFHQQCLFGTGEMVPGTVSTLLA